jgi:hypothetical protein
MSSPGPKNLLLPFEFRFEASRVLSDAEVAIRSGDIYFHLTHQALVLGEQSLFLLVSVPLRQGSEASIELTGDGRKIELQVRVEHAVFGLGTALRFLPLSWATRSKLRRLLADAPRSGRHVLPDDSGRLWRQR